MPFAWRCENRIISRKHKGNCPVWQNLQVMVVAFNTVGAVSINRTHEILSGVFNIPLATETIKNMVTRCAESLKGTYEQIRLKMIMLGLIHYDETGSRVDGKTSWVHFASDQDYTYLTINQRGKFTSRNSC